MLFSTRPFIMCHMQISQNMKATGAFLQDPQWEPMTRSYYHKHRELNEDGFICGRVTMEESFTHGNQPDLSPFEQEKIPREDWEPEWEEFPEKFAVAFDTHGKLGWKDNRIHDEDPGYDGHAILEVLSEAVPDAYLAYLRHLKIPYIFAGKNEIDIPTALKKLKAMGMEFLLLEGGPTLNGAFEQADCIDALSLIFTPAEEKNGADCLDDKCRHRYVECKSDPQTSWVLLNREDDADHPLISLNALEDAMMMASSHPEMAYDMRHHQVIVLDAFASEDPVFDLIREELEQDPDNQEWLEEADEGELADAVSWIRGLPCLPSSREGYQLMESFAQSRSNPKVKNQLMRALHQRRPFRRFKDAVDQAGLEEEWYAYQAQGEKEQLKKWCQENDFRWF